MICVFLSQRFEVGTQVMWFVALKFISDFIDSQPFLCAETSAFELH